MNNIGELYYNHFETYFGHPVERKVYANRPDWPSIQVLAYDQVFPACRVFATLGLSHFSDAVGGTFEIIVPVDGGWDDVPDILGNCLFYAVANRRRLGVGFGIGGIERQLPNFCQRFGKSAIYFTHPINLPDSFLTAPKRFGEILLGMFLSSEEFAYVVTNRVDDLEDTLERRNVDPFDLARSSCI